MAIFTDKEGRSWPLQVTAGSAKRVRSNTGIDLVGDVEKAMESLAADTLAVPDVVWSLLSSGDRAGLSPEEFADRFDGPAIDRATAALVEAIADFFPTGRRTLLRRAASMGSAIVEEMDRLCAEAAGAPTSGASSTSSPESAASIPPA